MQSLAKRRTSFHKMLRHENYLADISVDFRHDAYVISGELLNRSNIDSPVTGFLEVRHAILKSKQMTDVDDLGRFQIRLKPGASYHLSFLVEGKTIPMELDLL